MQDKIYKSKTGNIWKGIAMGIAEVIPGVSGGTIALITGIYEKLIYTIKSIDLSLIEDWKNQGWKGVSEKLDFPFLLFLISGMAIGILVGIFGVTYLLENYPEPLWGFFFGLIVASCIYVGRQIKKWNYITLIALFLGSLIAYIITTISPAEGSENFIYIFIAGAIAICALILPGISGSFILLLMGMYTLIIPTVRNFLLVRDLNSFLIILVFGLGCLTGLMLFSRLMHYLFDNYKNITLATLAGFMFGSLNKIWPWRNVEQILDKNTFVTVNIKNADQLKNYPDDGIKILSEQNVFPAEYWMGTPKVGLVIAGLIVGFLMVFIFEFLSVNKKIVKS